MQHILLQNIENLTMTVIWSWVYKTYGIVAFYFIKLIIIKYKLNHTAAIDASEILIIKRCNYLQAARLAVFQINAAARRFHYAE